MEYRIKSIKHSGRKGIRGTDRTDGRYPIRIGRTVDMDFEYIYPGVSMWLNYVKNSDGSDYSNKMLLTSKVVDIEKQNEDIVIVETINSIFEFEKEK